MAWLNKDFIHINKATVFPKSQWSRLLAGFRIFIHCAGWNPDGVLWIFWAGRLRAGNKLQTMEGPTATGHL